MNSNPMPPVRATALAGAAGRRLAGRQEIIRSVRRHPEMEDVHRWRVQTRRLLADVALLERALPRRVVRDARRVLKRQLRAAARLRDTQVHLEMIDSLRSREAELAAFRRHLRSRERRHAATLAEKLERDRSSRAMAVLAWALRIAADEGGITAGREPPRSRRVLVEAFGRALRLRARSVSDPKALHRLRVALKRYRYMAEALQSGDYPLRPGQREQLRAVQARLGDIHDLEELANRLRRFARRHPAGPRYAGCLRLLAGRRNRRLREQRGFTAAAMRRLAPN